MKTFSRLVHLALGWMKQKTTLVLVTLLSWTNAAWADAGSTAIGTIAKTVRTYLEPVQALMYSIAAIVAVVGAGTIFMKMQNGDQDVKKTIMLVIGGCIALVARATALPSFFPG